MCDRQLVSSTHLNTTSPIEEKKLISSFETYKTTNAIYELLKQKPMVTVHKDVKQNTITFLLNPFPVSVDRYPLDSLVNKLEAKNANFEYMSPSLIEFTYNEYNFVIFFHDVAGDSKSFTFDTIDVLLKPKEPGIHVTFCRKNTQLQKGEEHIKAEMLPEELLYIMDSL